LGVGLQLLTVKNKFVTDMLKKYRAWKDSLDKGPKRNKKDMRFGTWNVRSMDTAGSFRAALEEI
jgi:hypothetical protein